MVSERKKRFKGSGKVQCVPLWRSRRGLGYTIDLAEEGHWQIYRGNWEK